MMDGQIDDPGHMHGTERKCVFHVLVPDGKMERLSSIHFTATATKVMGMKGYEFRYANSLPRRLSLQL